MPDKQGPFLPSKAIDQIKELADSLREFEVAPLIGTGISSARGLPRWRSLVDRLILAWRRWDESETRQFLAPENYRRLIRRNFGSDLAVISYLRHRVDEYQHRLDKTENLTFSQLLYYALYSNDIDPNDTGPRREPDFTPTPNDIHFHLVSLFRDYPRRIWTTNYDDLIETAAKQLNIMVNTLDPDRRLTKKSLLVAHLHGFLAPPGRREDQPDPAEVGVSLALAEDDFHVIAADTTGWTNREFYRLFDEHTVLMLGTSLEDPNIRRVLAALKGRKDSKGGDQADKLIRKRKHYVVMRSWNAGDVKRTEQHDGVVFKDDDPDKEVLLSVCAQDSDQYRAWYWEQHGVEVIEVPSHEHMVPFLLRLRYETYGEKPGDLWRDGARHGYTSVKPWDRDTQQVARWCLTESLDALRTTFGCQPGELQDMGVFLLRPESKKIPDTLELTFRSGSKRPKKGERLFSANPDAPTGLAGVVFTSGIGARIRTSDELYDYGIPEEKRYTPSYVGIVSVPIVDWLDGGVPLGVIYVTITTEEGGIFNLLEKPKRGSNEESLESLYLWLQQTALDVLRLARGRRHG